MAKKKLWLLWRQLILELSENPYLIILIIYIKLPYHTSAIALACLTQRYTRHFTLLSDRYNSLTTRLATY
ncbi:hypothetical protein HUN01_17840 [Nostoc edaphicum CCNP1411]|uniref:Uncharacterized protein n=1 Tax=Nostoc edaphicum CCNP1411 TaxID=1472755 RepID=A0A7D7LF95_9NOSO|nr:hypothetical protein [Nostoc edaphicum]QMS89351.1 hypothetical protein HUN01_17840 [Nostoc edaphicum CCNP1411]